MRVRDRPERRSLSLASYRKGLRKRFDGRIALSNEEWLQRYGSDDSRADVYEFLSRLETIVGIPAGLLRPEDPITLFTAPPPARNWWRDHFHDFFAREALKELEDELNDRRKTRGLSQEYPPPETVAELIDLWCAEAG